MSGLIYLILLCLAIWFWLNGRRAHEFSLGVCRHICQQNQASLLDETISLKRLRLRRSASGHMQFERCFQFEYSYDGANRLYGDVIILGLTPVEINFDGQRTLL